MASVCTGVRITLAADTATGRRVTTHWSAIEEVRALSKAKAVVSDVCVVRNGSYVSSAGVSAGIDMALWLVGQIESRALARIICTVHSMLGSQARLC